MASLADLVPLVEELKRAGYSDAEIPGIIQRLHAGGYAQNVPVVTGQVETEREQAALDAAAAAQEARARTGVSLLDDARMRSQQLIDLQRDPDNIVSYFAAIAGLPEQGATPVQSLLGTGFKLEPTLPSPYADPNYIKLRDSLYDFGRPRTVEENVAEAARGRQAQLNQFAADQYRKDPNAFLKWTQATRGMAGGGSMKITNPVVGVDTVTGQPVFTMGEYGDETIGAAGNGLKITPLTQNQGEVPGNVQQMMFRMVGLPAQQIDDTVKSHAKGGKVPGYASGSWIPTGPLRSGYDANTRSTTRALNDATASRILGDALAGGGKLPYRLGGVPGTAATFWRNWNTFAQPAYMEAQRAAEQARAAGFANTPAGEPAKGSAFDSAAALLPSTSPAVPSTPNTDPKSFLNAGDKQYNTSLPTADAVQQAQFGPTLLRRTPQQNMNDRFPNFAGGGTLTPADAAFDAAAKIYEKNPFVGPDFLDALRNRRPPPPGSITQRFLANTPPSGWQALQAAIRARIGGTALDDYLSEVPRFFAAGAPPSSVRYV